MPSGGKREGAGRKSRYPSPKKLVRLNLSEQVTAALELAYDDWQTTHPNDSLSEFAEDIFRESERVKGWGV